MEKIIKILNHGFVRLVDHMGSDHAIAQAARVSYQKHDDEKKKDDHKLIRYLMSHKHTSPFEMVEFKFHCKMPIFVARQWVRHRTASLNEMSGRYSQLPADCYLPELERMQQQSTTNKQGSGDKLNFYDAEGTLDSMRINQRQAHITYDNYLNGGLSRELARINLPLSTYTEWYWKMDLHNLFHFLKLRLDPHAQYEIRVYAEAIYNIIKPIVPIACEAFDDYILNAVTFSAQEMQILRSWGIDSDLVKEDAEAYTMMGKLSNRELEEFKKKLGI